jgi:Putative prokaryotic signal transducing protein
MKAESTSSDYVRVYYTFVPANIINAKMILGREGIEYMTRNEDFAALYPGADGMATVDFLVNKNDEKRAKAALKDLIDGKH